MSLDEFFGRTKQKKSKNKITRKKVTKSEKKTSKAIHPPLEHEEHRDKNLYKLLEEVSEFHPYFNDLLGWTREKLFSTNHNLSPEKIASTLDIPLGMAIIILDNLKTEER